MDLVHAKYHILHNRIVGIERLVVFRNFIPTEAELDKDKNITTISFEYEYKCMYVREDCIKKYLYENKYIENAIHLDLGKHPNGYNVQRIFIIDVEPTKALLTDRYQLYDALTETYIPDTERELAYEDLKLRFDNIFKYQDKTIYDRVDEWIKNL